MSSDSNRAGELLAQAHDELKELRRPHAQSASEKITRLISIVDHLSAALGYTVQAVLEIESKSAAD